MNSAKVVRTRFAPSPTGFLHVGGIRTALYAWLLARQNDGKFILRIEDTDKAREVANSDQHIIDSLNALGLNYDEGPDISGDYGPYRQSERIDIYKRWEKKLLDSGRAYADPYSPAEVQKFRETAQKNKQPFLYRNHRPNNPPEWDGSQPLRFKSEPKGYTWSDAVMGNLSTGPEVIDDFIILKSDGYPTYNFAHIVDDYEMKISHIIRGQEFLASTPNYLNMYEALGIERPILATMPHILGPTGNKKLSKRDGAKDVLDYLADGILPTTLVNFIASLGWNDGSEQEVFSVPELIEKFSLNRVQKSGARFDEKRLTWMNGVEIRSMDIDKLYELTKDYLPEESNNYDNEYNKAVVKITQERLKYFKELPELTQFFFKEPQSKEVLNLFQDPKNKQLKKLDRKQINDLLHATINTLEKSSFDKADLESKLNQLLVDKQSKPGILFSIIRIAVSGAPASPQLFDTLQVLGKDKSMERLRKATELLN